MAMFENVIYQLLDNVVLSSFSSKDRLYVRINEYILEQLKKFRLIKNSLFRDEPVDFYKNYIPLTLENKSIGIKSDDPIDLLEKYNHVIVLGGAGSGKTTLLRYIILKYIEIGRNIPVSIDLRGYNYKSGKFEDYVAKTIDEKLYEDVKSLFGKGKFLFVMDGFDEIRYNEDEIFVSQIQNFALKYSDDKFIVSSRPGTNIQSLSNFYVVHLAELEENDVYIYLEKLALPSLVRRRLLDALSEKDHLKSMLTTPLFISLYAVYLSNNTELPSLKSVFFRLVLDSLLSKHDSVSKLGYVREKLSGLSKDDLESVSTVIAFRAFNFCKYQFSKDEIYREFQVVRKLKGFSFENEKLLYDLVITVNVLSEEGIFYSFPHILLMEYLAALFISRLDESKEGFYKRMLSNEGIRITISFMEFINELDKSYFSKFYLVPALEGMRGNFYYLDDENSLTIKKFVQLYYINSGSYFESYMIDEVVDRIKQDSGGILDDDFDILFGL